MTNLSAVSNAREKLELSMDRLDRLCQEHRDMQSEVSRFMQEYYGKTEAVAERLYQLKQQVTSLNYPTTTRKATVRKRPRLVKTEEKGSEATPRDTLKDTYMLLMRKHHPDHNPDFACADTVKEVTHAYKEGKHGSLWQMAFTQEWEQAAALADNMKLGVISYYQDRVDDSLGKIAEDISSLEQSEYYQLRLTAIRQRIQGYDFFADVIASMEQEIEELEVRLKYHQMRKQWMEESV